MPSRIRAAVARLLTRLAPSGPAEPVHPGWASGPFPAAAPQKPCEPLCGPDTALTGYRSISVPEGAQRAVCGFCGAV